MNATTLRQTNLEMENGPFMKIRISCLQKMLIFQLTIAMFENSGVSTPSTSPPPKSNTANDLYPPELTYPLKICHPKRKFHLPNHQFSRDMLVSGRVFFQGANPRKRRLAAAVPAGAPLRHHRHRPNRQWRVALRFGFQKLGEIRFGWLGLFGG